MRSMLFLVPAYVFMAAELADAVEPTARAVANPYVAGLVGDRYAEPVSTTSGPAVTASRKLPDDPLRALGVACRVGSRADAYAATSRSAASTAAPVRHDAAVMPATWVSDNGPQSVQTAMGKPTPPALLPHMHAAPVPNPQGMNPLRGLETPSIRRAGVPGPRDASNPLR